MSDRTMTLLALGTLLMLAGGVSRADDPPVTDPTIPPGQSAVARDAYAGTALRLQSTHVSASSRSAVINDRVVTPGGRVGGATVLSIEPGRVVLQRGKELVTLRMPAPPIKRESNGDEA